MKENQQTVLDILSNLRGIEPLKQLFWTELNYDRANEALSMSTWTDDEKAALAEDPILFAAAGQDADFHVIYCRLHSTDRLHIVDERLVINRLIKDHLYSLFIFSDESQINWHFVNVRNDQDASKRRIFRRISIGPYERLRTASERISMLDIACMKEAGGLFGLTGLDIQTQHDEAFNVEKVTKDFFNDYKDIFKLIQVDLFAHIKDANWAHDYALGFLNRIMFMHFIQRKRWLGDDTEFLKTYWEAYKDSGQPDNTFFADWLKPLFFEAFNNQKGLFNSAKREHIPAHLRQALITAPYLNGGLFRPNKLDNKYSDFSISDNRLKQVFTFLDSYNFTIAEDSPLDQEVAVDPEMIGKVYESLVNVSVEADERGDAGIFYTPRTEIDLICRLALVDNISNRIGLKHRSLLYELIFALEPNDKIDADLQVNEAGLWSAIYQILQSTSIVDPACGSGSFLVGMLQIIDDLQTRAQKYLQIDEDSYERRKRIIGQNLYGVDAMEWASHIAELRLWLALIIDAGFTREELSIRKDPLLPHFTFNIRNGDSLVQEVGGIDLGHLNQSSLSLSIKSWIKKLKEQKIKYYNCDSDCEYKNDEQARNAERKLFHDIIQEQINYKKKSLQGLTGQPVNGSFEGFTDTPTQQTLTETAELRKQKEELQVDISTLEKGLTELDSSRNVPFVWNIAFAEVFSDEKNGFDIVIGNPPYVRQEDIADPMLNRDNVTDENKRQYKDKLMRNTYLDWRGKNNDGFFKFDPYKLTAKRKLNAKSDLYIYFYFRGLHLLNSTGSFVFITSNSWLDVGYGADLQEFLLKYAHVKFIIDNQAKRSFADADVNTVICLFSAPSIKSEWGLGKDARFVMFKVPFEQIVSAIVFEELEEAVKRRSTQEFRIQVFKQSELLDNGIDVPDEDDENAVPETRKTSNLLIKNSKYTGDKWGGKYLRAPDIYWTILEKGKDKLVKLGSVADVRRGFTTGCNDFFYIRVLEEMDGLAKIRCDDGSEHMIEAEYVTDPVLVKAREIMRPLVDRDLLRYRLVRLDENAVKRKHASQYIKWGESKGFHLRPTTRNRKPWFIICPQPYSELAFPMAHKRRAVLGYVRNSKIHLDNRFYGIIFQRADVECAAATLFSTFGLLCKEIYGRVNFGQGMLDMKVYEAAALPVIDGTKLKTVERERLIDCWQAAGRQNVLMIFDDVKRQERTAMDMAFISACGFTSDEAKYLVDELQSAACRMIWARMAKSGNSRESRMTYDEWLASGEPFGLNIEDE